MSDADRSDALDRILQLPCWSGKVDPVPLLGGITNNNYLVGDRGQKFVVRLGEDIPVHGVMRFNELAASRAAFEAGVSPEVVTPNPERSCCATSKGVRFARAVRDLTASSRAGPDQRCHEQVPRHLRGPALIFWVFQIFRDYATDLGVQEPHGLRSCRGCSSAPSGSRRCRPRAIVFGHNDLLAANFIDDGKRLWLIDWDYAGFNSPLFDLGDLASNNELRGSRRVGCSRPTSSAAHRATVAPLSRR